MITSKFIASLGFAATLLASHANAVVVDLENNDQGTAGGGPTSERMGIFQFTDQQPTGTGVIDPFLTIQAEGTEQGYNTSGQPAPFDVKRQPQYTHDIKFSDLQATTTMLNGISYFQILLDVNEPNGAKSIIKLDELQIYTSPIGSQTTTNVSSLGTLRYDLDGNGDNTVVFDASLNHGSGSGDAYIYIPFFVAQNSDFVYLYAAFGDSEGDAQAGFEEFALVQNITPIPELSSFFPIIGLMVAVGSTSYLRKRKLAQSVA